LIEELKIKEINPPEGIPFSLRRKVLVEKYIKYFSITRDFEHYRNTVLNSGEYIWVIDSKSLAVERYTISVAPTIFRTDGRIFLFNKSGDMHGVQVALENYLLKIDTTLTVFLSGKGIGGEKLICSSERNVLITLKNFIPSYNRLIEGALNRRNTSHDKFVGKKERMKKLQKLHKKLVEFLNKN
jgi:hypothetical protein